MYRGEVPGACFQNHLILFRAEPEVIPEFALLVFRHYLHDGIFKAIARWSTNIATLGIERFRKLPFPLPPFDEQKRIVVEARRRLDANAAQLVVVETSLLRFPEMERELFAAAVAGELAPQDSSEEPAEEMAKRLGPVSKASARFEAEKSERGEKLMAGKESKASRKPGIMGDLASTLQAAGRPLSLPELFVRAGYDRDEPEHVERFYLSLRLQIGKTIRQIGDATENAQLEAIDAP
jgi:type I restriction enzyme S subunit